MALTRPLTRRCDLCGTIGGQHRRLAGDTVCLPCFAEQTPCSTCGTSYGRRHVVTDAVRERLPDLAKRIDVLCNTCYLSRLQAREREAIRESRQLEATVRGRRRR